MGQDEERREKERLRKAAYRARKRELEAEAEQRVEPLPVEPPSIPVVSNESVPEGTALVIGPQGIEGALVNLDQASERSLEDLAAPGVYDLTEEEEQRLRDFWGYAPSEKRTKRQRDEAAGRIMASERVQAEVEWAQEVWHRQGEQMEASRKPTPDLKLDPKLSQAVKRNPWDG